MKFLKEMRFTKKQIIVTGVALLFLIGSICAVGISTMSKNQKKLNEIKLSKVEKNYNTKADESLDELAEKTGVSKEVIAHANGDENISETKLPENGSLKVIKDTTVRRDGGKLVADIKSKKSQNSKTISVKTVPVAKTKDENRQPIGNQTVVMVEDENQKLVADVVVVEEKNKDGKTTYEEKEPVVPNKIKEEDKDKVVTTEEKKESDVKKTEKDTNKEIQKEKDKGNPNVTPVEKPKDKPKDTSKDNTTAKVTWTEQTRKVPYKETVTKYREEEYIEPVYRDVAIERDGIFYMNKNNVKTFWYWADEGSGLSEEDKSEFLKKIL